MRKCRRNDSSEPKPARTAMSAIGRREPSSSSLAAAVRRLQRLQERRGAAPRRPPRQPGMTMVSARRSSASECDASLRAGAPDFVLLDVRGPDLYARGHVPRAINLPHGKIVESRMAAWPVDTLFVVCCAGPHLQRRPPRRHPPRPAGSAGQAHDRGHHGVGGRRIRPRDFGAADAGGLTTPADERTARARPARALQPIPWRDAHAAPDACRT
jgi:hypothetical protein